MQSPRPCLALLLRLCLLLLPLARAAGADLRVLVAPRTLRSDEVTLL